ncbi:MAG: FAD-dependent oxidoreductase [Desulfobacterales bacterium]|nr:FAD-dependent oxidoreductase [Desulfobacterales bacterium]
MAKQYDYDIGIIGGGAAGLTTASGAAQLGAKTLLIEKEKDLGGDCLHFGCVPSKTLINSARAYHTIVNAGKHGLPDVDAPPVDFAGIRNRIKNVISTIQEHDSEERFCGLGAKVEFGSPEFVDEYSVSLNGNTVSAKKWLIATGSSPGAPPVPGLEQAGYITNREIFSLEKLPASMAIIGGGPIAVEMGQAFSRLGTQVTIIEGADQILGKEDKDLADELKGLLASPNLTLHLNSKILSAKDSGGKKEVVFENASGEEKQVQAETLLVAAGRTPNIEGLSLEKAGVDFTGRGITVDARMRTSQKHIFAAGDVTGSFLFTHAAGYEGSIVIANAVFRLPRKADYTFLPWCTYTDPELASIGMNEKSAKQAGISYSVWREDFKDNDRSLAMGNTAGQIKMILDEKENLMGVQILGPNAGDLINEWVAVLAGRVKLSTLASAVHPYPTLGEINKRVAGAYLSPKIFSDRIKKGLKFFFALKGRACGKDSA